MTAAPVTAKRPHFVSDQIVGADGHVLFAGATATVSQSSVNSVLYADERGAGTVANPCPLNSAGQIDFFAAPGAYDVTVTYTRDDGTTVATIVYTANVGVDASRLLVGDVSGNESATSVDKVRGTASSARTAWTALPTLQNSWANKSGGVAGAYSKDVTGFVHLRGQIDAGTKAVGTLITTLPAGFRPTVAVRIAAVDNVAATSTAPGELLIGTDGTVSVGDVALAASSYISLDGILFDTVA